jgi:hypothetical protein
MLFIEEEKFESSKVVLFNTPYFMKMKNLVIYE